MTFILMCDNTVCSFPACYTTPSLSATCKSVCASRCRRHLHPAREQWAPVATLFKWPRTCRSGGRLCRVTCHDVVAGGVSPSGGPLRGIMVRWQSRRLKSVIPVHSRQAHPVSWQIQRHGEIAAPVRFSWHRNHTAGMFNNALGSWTQS